jgi:hypothetical protein
MVHNVEFSCSHISFVIQTLYDFMEWILCSDDCWLVQTWQMLCGFKTILTDMNILNSYRYLQPKKGEIPNTRNTRWFWKKIGYGLGIAKNNWVGSGIGYPSGTVHITLWLFEHLVNVTNDALVCQPKFRQQNQLLPSIVVGSAHSCVVASDAASAKPVCFCTPVPGSTRPLPAYLRSCRYRRKAKAETAWQTNPHPTQVMRSRHRGFMPLVR